MNKEEIITAIVNRIVNEQRKHPDLDWPLIAANKIYTSFISKDTIPHKPLSGDYYESTIEGNQPSTRVKGLTWKQEYERDLTKWNLLYSEDK